MIENMMRLLREGEFISVEITPRKSARFSPVVEKLQSCKNISAKACAFSVTDNPLAKLKYSAMLAGIKVQNELKKPALITLSMRDKNLLALQSEILGANEFGIRTFLTLTGDPAKLSDQPRLKGVFEGDSSLLLKIVRHLNVKIDYSGREITGDIDKIYAFSVMNSNAKNFATLEKKMQKKIENGSSAIITQPIFDLDIAKRLLDAREDIRGRYNDERKLCELVLGFFPITRLKTAQFLASHVPGIYVPDDLLELLYKASLVSEEEEGRVGLEYSKELFFRLKALHPKIHIMSANRFEVIEDILEHA